MSISVAFSLVRVSNVMVNASLILTCRITFVAINTWKKVVLGFWRRAGGSILLNGDWQHFYTHQKQTS